MKAITITAALTLLVLGGAGCSATSAPSTSAASIDPGRVSPTDLPTPPTVQEAQGAVRDLTLGECKTQAGKQTVSGELTSSQAERADFLVTISWTTSTGDVMGRGFKVIQNLKPGKTKKFVITATVAAGATQCVPGVEFGTIEK
ncbi:hypothetical protein [Micropruina sp.]|uniref:hypothetical protein n=1 Tax=Micropruina sp. TaxID=2737536 RepID=UPI0039E4412B